MKDDDSDNGSNGNREFARFEQLTKRLLRVPKTEVDARRKKARVATRKRPS